jgi:hypothetical protein
MLTQQDKLVIVEELHGRLEALEYLYKHATSNNMSEEAEELSFRIANIKIVLSHMCIHRITRRNKHVA